MHRKPSDLCKTAARAASWKGLALVAALAGYTASAATPTLTGVDVGYPPWPGSVTTAADGKITVTGGGGDIWGASDSFHYAYFNITGDFDYVVKVESLQGNAGDGGWSKAELMARLEDPAAPGVGPQGGDPHLSNMTTRPASDTPPTDPDTGVVGAAGVNHRGPQWRAQRDGQSSWTTPNPGYPPNMPDNWMRMERIGSTFYLYTSNDGTTWNMYNPYDPQGWDTAGSWPPGTDNPDVAFFTEAWPNTIMLGLAVTAHANDYTSTAVFSNFGPYTPVPIAITKQPDANVAVSANNKLTLSVEATGDPVHYQWRKNGVAVSTNGLGATYTIDLAKESDSGSYTVRLFGGGTEVISQPSVVTVTQDTTPPTLVKANASASYTHTTVEFSEPVNATAETAANYTFDQGVTVTSVARVDLFTVTLTHSRMADNTVYALTVSGVQDTATPPNAIAANTKVNVQSYAFKTGVVLHKFWQGVPNNIQGLIDDPRFPDSPTFVTIEPMFEYGPGGSNESGSDYGNQLIAWFIPPANGNYVFFVNSDDPSDLYLSTDDNPANKKLIAQETGWSDARNWLSAGSGDVSTKRSDQFWGTEWPTANTITLQAGNRYYIEALHTEGGGGDNVAATFIREGADDPANGTAPALTGAVIGAYVDPTSLPPVLTQSPDEAYTIAGGGTATLSMDAEGATSFKWQLNGKDVPGATSKSYVIANAGPAHIGQYRGVASNENGSVISNPAKVLVTAANPFVIEAEDFNYDSGQTKPEASVMPYLGGAYAQLGAVVGVDYASNDGDDSPEYRTLHPSQGGDQNKSMNDNLGAQWGRTRAGAWDVTTNYKLGWVDTSDWGNYTRTFPDATYEVFAALSYDGLSDSQLRGKLDLVTSSATAPNQTLEAIGQFDAPGSGGWGRNNLVRMTDTSGNPKTVALSGQKTVRFTMDSGDFDYLLFIPASGTPPENSFTSVGLTGGNLSIAWSGGTLESADAVTGPWTAVAGATSPASIPTTGAAKFYRLR